VPEETVSATSLSTFKEELDNLMGPHGEYNESYSLPSLLNVTIELFANRIFSIFLKSFDFAHIKNDCLATSNQA